MRFWTISVLALVVALSGTAGRAQEPASPAQEAPSEYFCLTCHAEPELWEGEDVRFYVTEKDLAADVHWQKGLRCHDCHGGKPDTDSFVDAHGDEFGFRSLKSPVDVPGFCGRCHSNIEYMRRFRPSPRTDQVAEYWTSGHGRRLKESGDTNVATCVSCHGRHGILAVDDLTSPVYPTRVADTCAACHGDAEHMAGYEYHGRALGNLQHERWKKSVHAEALLERGDLSAPTCNDCHGNHGAVPPEVGSVANACGSCHGKVAELFTGARMKHRFEEVGLPGCATCHGYHEIRSPTDEMLGMGQKSVCLKCHLEGNFGATITGAGVAGAMRAGIERLKADISHAASILDEAERLGMEVRPARFDLTKATNALTNARSLIHGFAVDKVERAVSEGRDVAASVTHQGEAALKEHRNRRLWLATSLVAILAMIGVLLVFIRRYPVPRVGAGTAG